MKQILLIGLLHLIIVAANSQNCLDGTTYSGTATYYSFIGIGNCGDSIKTSSMNTVALNNTMYDSSNACGSCLEVTGKLGSVIVTVKDICPSCPANNMDLSQLAFSGITNLSDGITNITWKSVDCPVTGGIIYYFSNSSNPYYIDLQIRNIRYAVKTVELKNNGSSYALMQRQSYNSFVILPQIMPATSPFNIRVTDILGNVIEEQVPFNVGVETKSTFQFPLCVSTEVDNQKQQEKLVNVYPNPSNSTLFIEGGCTRFILFELSGKIVLQKNNCSQIDISTFQRGLYYYNITTDKGTFTQKIIIN